VFGHLIDSDIRQRSKHKLPSSRYAAAGSSKLGKILQAGASVIDRSGNPARSFRIVALYPFAKCALNLLLRVSTSGLPSGTQKPVNPLADLVVSEIFA
jgi:hypothetical protein